MVDYLTPSVPDARSRQHFSRDLGVHNMNVMAAKVVLIVVLGSIAVVGMLFGFTALTTTAPGHEPDPVAYRDAGRKLLFTILHHPSHQHHRLFLIPSSILQKKSY